jgi:predicted permease
METMFLDMRYALRIFRKSPTFTAVVILTLALGIGANTAIFSVVNAVLLRSLPYHDPEQLVRVSFERPSIGLHDSVFSYTELEDLQNRAGVFQDVSAVWPVSVNLTGAKEPQRLELLVTSPNYFSMLGIKPQIGRLFGQQDQALGFAPAAVISDGLWRRSFGADPGIISRDLRLDNDLYTVVGVLPPDFRHPGKTVANDVEVFATAGFRADPFPPVGRSVRFLPGAVARLKPGIRPTQAQARLNIMSAELAKEFPNDYPPLARFTINIEPLQKSLVGDVRPMMLVLMGAVILIILVASVNIASLLLARASGRQSEIALRLTLGASRGRMVRQLLTEALLLSLLAGIAGIVTARIALGSLLRFLPPGTPRLNDVRVDLSVLLFATAISILTGLLFGLAPALQSTRAEALDAIREGARGTSSGKHTSRLRSVLIASELALAVVLMIGAGLLLRSFAALLRENPGFNPPGLAVASFWLAVPNDPKSDLYANIVNQTAFDREVLRRVRAIPGVEIAGMTSALPASGQTFNTALFVEDRPVESSQDLRTEIINISPGYFETLQTPLIRGRFFTDSDDSAKDLLAIIDEFTARRYWGDRDPLGRRVRLGQGPNSRWFSIVGIVADIRHDSLERQGIPHVYIPMYQRRTRAFSFAMRTRIPAALLEPQIRHEVQSVDAGTPVFAVRTMQDVLDTSLAPRRFTSSLIGLFALVALLLACTGIYGLLAYMVGQKSYEIGIRMALGAQRGDILRLILGKGMLLSTLGIVAGLMLAAAAAPALASLLYGVRPIDLPIFLAVPVTFLFVTLIASWIPARRAMRLDPAAALRER